MNHILSIQSNHCIRDLLEELLSFKFWKCTLRLQVCLKISTLAQLKDEIVSVLCALISEKFYYISVFDTIQDCKFLIQKLLHVLLFDHVELDHFDRDWSPLSIFYRT